MLLLVTAGCTWLDDLPERQDVPSWRASARETEAVRRVMVLPFAAAPDVYAETEMLRRVFLGALAKTRRFELVPLPQGAPDEVALWQGLRTGRLSADALAELGERYRLDGVLLATVTGYRPYKPPHLGMRLQLVSLQTAEAVWASEVFYDAGDAATVRDIRHYAQSAMAKEDSLHGWELVLISPERFASFVAHRVVETWRRG